MLIFVGLITSTENVQKNFNVIFVISGVIASFWRVFIKFRWHGQKFTIALWAAGFCFVSQFHWHGQKFTDSQWNMCLGKELL